KKKKLVKNFSFLQIVPKIYVLIYGGEWRRHFSFRGPLPQSGAEFTIIRPSLGPCIAPLGSGKRRRACMTERLRLRRPCRLIGTSAPSQRCLDNQPSPRWHQRQVGNCPKPVGQDSN